MGDRAKRFVVFWRRINPSVVDYIFDVPIRINPSVVDYIFDVPITTKILIVSENFQIVQG